MKIIIISNPKSGSRGIKEFHNELKTLLKKTDFEIWETQTPNHAIDLAQKAVKKNPDIIVAAGGDGTVIQVISGMVDSSIKLGIIPNGTGNMLSSDLGIPLNTKKAVEVIQGKNTKKIDIGKINDRYFAFLAGCGLDSEIMRDTTRERKRKLGLWAYFVEGFKLAFRSRKRFIRFKIKIDDKKPFKTIGISVMAANSANILGQFFTLAPHASLNDGFLDLIIISPRSMFDYFPVLFQIITRRSLSDERKIRYFRAKEIEISSEPVLNIQADGDIIGKTPVKISVIPSCIEVLIPKNRIINIPGF